MKPSAPNKIIWIIGLIAGVLGIIGHYTHVDILTQNNFLLVLIGFLALAVGTSFKGI